MVTINAVPKTVREAAVLEERYGSFRNALRTIMTQCGLLKEREEIVFNILNPPFRVAGGFQPDVEIRIEGLPAPSMSLAVTFESRIFHDVWNLTELEGFTYQITFSPPPTDD